MNTSPPVSFDVTDYVSVKCQNPVGWEVEFTDETGEPFGAERQVIAVTIFGSHLYGTATPSSDVDLKGIFLGEDAGIIQDHVDRSKNWSSGPDGKNTNDDVDVELIEFRKFVDDLLSGQTYAVEMLHVPEEYFILEDSIWKHARANREHAISQNVMPFIGYCRQQAKKYSMKGRRLSAVREVLGAVEEGTGDRVGDYLPNFPLDSEHVELFEQPIENQDPVEMIRVANKRFELTAPIGKLKESMEAVEDRYGKRTEKAAEDGIDWKATSHAYRIAYELIELLEDGTLTFPRPRADFLRRVKEGEVDESTVEGEVSRLAEEAIETESDLPEEPDKWLWENFLVRTYREGVFDSGGPSHRFESREELIEACEAGRTDLFDMITEDAWARGIIETDFRANTEEDGLEEIAEMARD